MNEYNKEKIIHDTEAGKVKVDIYEPINYQYGISYNFDVGMAQKYGVNEAIILNHLIFWIRKNEANNTNFFDGYYWTFNSISAYQKLFPFWTERQVRYILKSLEKKGVIKTGKYNKMKYDHTLWYTITEQTILQNCQINLPKVTNQNAQSVKPIPDINTQIKNTYMSKESDIEYIYNEYLSKCNINNNYLKSKSINYKQIDKLLKKYSKEEILKAIRIYLDKNKYNFKKQFKSFLNQFDEIKEQYIDSLKDSSLKEKEEGPAPEYLDIDYSKLEDI